MPVQYTHTPLRRRSIRVIHLNPVLDYSQPLQCRIQEVSLDDENLSYSALSYAWDAEVPVIPFICNGKELLITVNCEKGLRQFSKIPAGRIMWIDSICINQYDQLERNHQVQLMGEIYTRATTVLVWLGDPDENTIIAFDQIRRLGESTHSSALASQSFRTDLAGAEDMIPYLFQRSWFQRMWVVQEASLPQQDRVLVFCGSAYIRWRHLIQGTLKFRDKYPLDLSSECMDAFILLHSTLIREQQIRTGTSSLKSKRIFSKIVQTTAHKKCQNQRDNIFALFTVFKRLGLDLPLPDYSSTVHNVHLEAMLTIANHEQSIEITLTLQSQKFLQQTYCPQLETIKEFTLEGFLEFFDPEEKFDFSMSPFRKTLYDYCQIAIEEGYFNNGMTYWVLRRTLEQRFQRSLRMLSKSDIYDILAAEQRICLAFQRCSRRQGTHFIEFLKSQMPAGSSHEISAQITAWCSAIADYASPGNYESLSNESLSNYASIASEFYFAFHLIPWYNLLHTHSEIHSKILSMCVCNEVFENYSGIISISDFTTFLAKDGRGHLGHHKNHLLVGRFEHIPEPLIFQFLPATGRTNHLFQIIPPRVVEMSLRHVEWESERNKRPFVIATFNEQG